MILLSNAELNDIYGGGFSISLSLAIAALVTFAVGIIDGYVRPLRCR
ncbi:MAG: hypothetical protein PHI22_00630 [Bacilli bacterium]|nr:hypothetical protein [Bacilli bacterium]MDD4298073.1 hypothetical protein [Bacilli bacterium]MDD4643448.1 hypothetical protein [Bacilli bacterium]